VTDNAFSLPYFLGITRGFHYALPSNAGNQARIRITNCNCKEQE
jgi:hypothetical protein